MQVLVFTDQDKQTKINTILATVIELGVEFPYKDENKDLWINRRNEITEHLIDLFRPLWICNSQDFNFIFEGEDGFEEKIKELGDII